jgi:Ribosome biogenesis regulatory protein (RRS1)
MEVYELRGLILVREKGERGAMQEGLSEFFQRMKALPTKYDLSRSIYVLPEKEACEEVRFPRSREIPREKEKTRWQVFAEEKGIKKKSGRKGGRVRDEETGEYAPAFGRGSRSDVDRNWLIELKDNEDPGIDRHSLLGTEKRKRVQKNKDNREKNQRRASAGR